jgi:hypothetical protein
MPQVNILKEPQEPTLLEHIVAPHSVLEEERNEDHDATPLANRVQPLLLRSNTAP